MGPDGLFVTGVLLLALSVPRTLAGLANSRKPVDGVLMAIAGGVVLVLAFRAAPQLFTLHEAAMSFVRVFAYWWT